MEQLKQINGAAGDGSGANEDPAGNCVQENQASASGGREKNKLVIIGGGPGSGDFLLPAAREAIKTAGYVFADKRYASLISHERAEVFGPLMDTVERIGKKLQECDVAVIVSGDPLFYSLTRLLKNKLPKTDIKIIPGIGSLQYLAAKAGRTTEYALFVSAHGREADLDGIFAALREQRDVYVLCDKNHTPQWMAKLLVKEYLGQCLMCVGRDLSYDNEEIVIEKACELVDKSFAGLCVMGIFPSQHRAVCENTVVEFQKQKTQSQEAENLPGVLLCDSDFMRDKVPMTREEVRWTILGKLHLQPGDVLWDIGAGTGSVTVECARQLQPLGGHVYAVERRADAAALIRANSERFALDNVTVIHGDALECVKAMPIPTAVFVGGSGRELSRLLAFIQSLKEGIRVIVACVTMETVAEALNAFNDTWQDVDMVQINIGKGRQLGSYHVMDSGHGVTLFCGRTSGRPDSPMDGRTYCCIKEEEHL